MGSDIFTIKVRDYSKIIGSIPLSGKFTKNDGTVSEEGYHWFPDDNFSDDFSFRAVVSGDYQFGFKTYEEMEAEVDKFLREYNSFRETVLKEPPVKVVFDKGDREEMSVEATVLRPLEEGLLSRLTERFSK